MLSYKEVELENLKMDLKVRQREKDEA